MFITVGSDNNDIDDVYNDDDDNNDNDIIKDNDNEVNVVFVVDNKIDNVEKKSVADCFLLKKIVRCSSCDMRFATSGCRIKL